MRNEEVVPTIMLLMVGVVLILVGISFSRSWGSPLWLYCPGLIVMGLPMLISGLVMLKEDTTV